MKYTILYLGSLNEHSNSYRRYKTLQSLGHEVIGIDVESEIYQSPYVKFHHHLNFGPGIQSLNKKIIDRISEKFTDIIWLDNRSFLQSKSLKKIKSIYPSIKIINLVTDDLTGSLKYQWRLTLKNVAFYDCFFVQRETNIKELKELGAKKAELCYRSYDPDFHRPIELNKEDEKLYKASVGFVGTYESFREEYIAFLIQNNIPVSVTGDGWKNGKYWNIVEPYYRGASTYGDSYVKTINGMDIALHFLRHQNRDAQDSRTFEIPACGAFMLAERSTVHTSLFNEGTEADFFSSKEELLKKVQYYLQHKDERERIAEAGLARCIAGGYSHEQRLLQVLKTISALP